MENTARPGWVTIVSVLFLLWNLVGIAAFVMQYSMTPADIAKLSSVEQAMWGEIKPWTWAAYAVAVLSGTAGAIALLRHSVKAVPLFLLSIAALLVQFSYAFGFVMGAGHLEILAFPTFIIVMAVVEFFFSRDWRNKNWQCHR